MYVISRTIGLDVCGLGIESDCYIYEGIATLYALVIALKLKISQQIYMYRNKTGSVKDMKNARDHVIQDYMYMSYSREGAS